MKDKLINSIVADMNNYLNNYQLEQLKKNLTCTLCNIDFIEKENALNNNIDYNGLFLSSKKLEGCSPRTIDYYSKTINDMLNKIDKNVKLIDTNDLREYLVSYQSINDCGNVTIDNIRRILSSFFSWLESEDYILKSPIRRIHRIKTQTIIKETYSDENIEKLRDGCKTIRDLALVDFLSSTGVRVGELVNLNIDDIDFINQSCVVLGKGNKEREVYFDAKTKLHLEKYLSNRNDDNPALFVSLLKPYNRLNISGVEIRLRNLGERLNLPRVHPHKFRRTLATRAIDKGMPIEQVQQLLGHTKIDTTLHYAKVNQANVKVSHHRFITIPAGSTETYVYSDVEISPKKNKIKIFSGEGLGDTEVILKPIEVNEENVDDRGTYLTHGMPVKMEVEKGAWFRIGVNMQNPTDEDIVVYVKVKDVDLRIE